MNNGSVTTPSMTPLTPAQRQRLECMTAVRALWAKTGPYGNYAPVGSPEGLSLHEILELTDYLVTGEKP